jgi:alcohol dehydrogenase class IV
LPSTAARSACRPLLVTDAGLATAPMAQQVLADLSRRRPCAALFSDIRPNPVGANLEAGVAAYRAGGTMAWSPSAAAAASTWAS